MNFKELLAAAVAAALMLLASPHMAWADGPVSAYEGSEDLALAPNERMVSEALVNDDGAAEDPRAPMTPTARAFRNGLLNGRAMQKQLDTQATPALPPLPPEMMDRAAPQPKGYAGYPPAAQVQAIPAQPVQRPMYAPVQQPPQVVYQQSPPVVVNVVQPDPRYYEPADQFGRAPSWRNRQEALQEYGYDPYSAPTPPTYQSPPPVYYTSPPVYVQQPPVVIASGYVRRMAPAYPAYYGGSIGLRGRGWGARVGW